MKKALIILDMLNKLDFPEGNELLPFAILAAKKIHALKQKCKEQNIPVIYVNDNFGQWRSDWKELFNACLAADSKGHEIARLLKPEKEDFFILKPMHSGFYLTPLELLLNNLHCQELILTGVAGNICVLFTAHDAHMRQFKIHVPKDCIASNTKEDNDFALHQFDKVLGFKIDASTNF
jgi:nicotinamidase-related amidase